MLTAELQAPRKLAIVERPRPAPGAGEVLVRIAATAVCHTDLSLYAGNQPGVRYPLVMGHEATGTIVAIGPEVTGLEPGQNVIINPIITCGKCDCSSRGAGHLCRNAGRCAGEVEGSLSQFVRLAARYVFVVPPGLPLVIARPGVVVGESGRGR